MIADESGLLKLFSKLDDSKEWKEYINEINEDETKQ